MSTVVDLMAASDDEGDEIEYVGTLPADEAEVAAPLAPPSPTAPPSDNEELGESNARTNAAARHARAPRARSAVHSAMPFVRSWKRS